MGRLYLVATPIGNLEDVSARALRILRDSTCIAAEDTRTTGKLLAHYQIRTPLIAYHEHNKLQRLEEVLQELAAGDVALVSDAGTPGLNDPGYELVQAAITAGIEVSPVPGPCAPIAALVASGLPTDSFLYLGYFPRKEHDRRKLLRQILAVEETIIALEAPHRLLEALSDLQLIFGDRKVAVARELTKIHEEILRGSVSNMLSHFQEVPPLGEITLVISGAGRPGRWTEEQVRAEVKKGLQQSISPSEMAIDLAVRSGWRKREIYRIIHEFPGS